MEYTAQKLTPGNGIGTLTDRLTPPVQAEAPRHGGNVAQFLNPDATLRRVYCIGRLRHWHPKARPGLVSTWGFELIQFQDSTRKAAAAALALVHKTAPHYSWSFLVVK